MQTRLILRLFPERSSTYCGLLLSKASMLLCKKHGSYYMIIWVTAQTALAACLWLLASMRYLQNCCPEEVFSFFTNMKRGLCVKIPSEQHFLRYSEQHRRPQHIQSRLKWTRFPFLRKSLNFNSLADANVNSLPVTWQQIKTSLPTRNKRWLAENIVQYGAVICSYILKVMD